MSLTKNLNQLYVGPGYNVAVAPVPVAQSDSAVVAMSKVQSQLFALGSGTYISAWDAATNTPTLSNATIEAAGNWYSVSAAGTVDFGAGPIVFTTSDAVYSNGVTYEKRDLPNSSIALPEDQILVGQSTGLAAPKPVGGELALDQDGNFTINFDSRLTAGAFQGTLQGGGVQYFNADINLALADFVVGMPYILYNSDTVLHDLTVTGAGAVVIGGDALTAGLVQTVNPGTGYTFTLQNATTILIS